MMNNDEKMDKLSEWIKMTIEQGDDRPIVTPNVTKQSSNSNQNSKQTTAQNRPFQKSPYKQFNKQSAPVSITSGKPAHGFHKHMNQLNKPTSSFRDKQGTKSNKPMASQSFHHKKQTEHPKFHNRPQGSSKYPNKQQKPTAISRLKSSHVAKTPKKHLSGNQPVFKGLRIIPVGGMDEIGKNLTVFEYNKTGLAHDKEIIVVDMGLQFPEEDMLGVDYVIPDATYLEENQKKIKAIIITHGHLDHIGGIPYILPKIGFPPIYATRLTKGLIEGRVEEFHLERYTKIHTINPDEPLKIGSFKIDFFRVAHSIPDSVGLVITTPEGKIVHTGDFKFDDSPAGIQKKADMEKIRALGSQNILALFSDSTNALKPGHTMSELEIGRNLEDLITQAKGRVIIASFSSLIGRIQQIFEYAKKTNRNIYISGRSMKENINLALNLGYLKIHTNLIRDIKKVTKAPDKEVLILTTGSQGEAVSALTKISLNDHPQVKIKHGDTVIVSSTPIIGNERSIYTVINNLCMLGANVIHHQIGHIHTSGHGYQDELMQMINMVKPKYFIPVHGEYFMRQAHKELGVKCGIPEKNCIMVRNGDILEVSNNEFAISKNKVEAKYILIDGLGEGTVGSQVMVDRQRMSLNGILVIILPISEKTKQLKDLPNILSRGFIYMHEYDEITAELSELIANAYKDFIRKRPDATRKEIKSYINGLAEKYTHQKIERRPLILSLVFES